VDSSIEFDAIPIFDVEDNLVKNTKLSDLYAYLSFVSNRRDNATCARSRKVASLKSFYKYLKNKAQLINENPAQELEAPKILKKLPRYLNVDESRQLLSSVNGPYPKRDYAIITLFLNCGMRLSELVGINEKSIKGDTLVIIGKGGKERTVYLNEACLHAIEEYTTDSAERPRDRIKDKSALFLSERKQRISPSMVQHIVKRYITQAGLDPNKYSTHKLRHTAATLMYKHGKVDIRALQEILGHQSISTTEIYTHLDNEQLRTAAKSNPLSSFQKPDIL
jgi:site-specific recombinase XerD